jgi:hypothetical protein
MEENPTKPKERTLIGSAEAPFNRARSSRNGGRDHPGTAAKSSWNAERHQIGIISDSRATSLGTRMLALAAVPLSSEARAGCG